MSNNSNKELEGIDEERAFFELCQIIGEAIENQNVELLQARINEWKSRYPWEKFSDYYKSKIKYLLSQNYMTQITSRIYAMIETKKDFDSSRAYLKLYRIVKNNTDLVELKKKIKQWESEYPIDKFTDMYKKKVKYITSESSLKEHAFNQDDAFAELRQIVNTTSSTFDELKYKVTEWEKKYPIEDFVKHTSEVESLSSDEYLQEISRKDELEDSQDSSLLSSTKGANASSTSNVSSLLVQEGACIELMKILNNPQDVLGLFDWTYKNRTTKFDDEHKGLIISKTALYYPSNYLKSAPKPLVDLKSNELSFEEFKSINDARKYTVATYLFSLSNNKKLPQSDLASIYKKSERAKLIDKISKTTDKSEQLLDLSVEEPTPFNLVNSPILQEADDELIINNNPQT